MSMASINIALKYNILIVSAYQKMTHLKQRKARMGFNFEKPILALFLYITFANYR